MACSCDDAIPHTEAAAAAKLHDAKTTSSSTVRPTSSVAASIMFLPRFPAHAECLQGCHLPPFLLHPPDFCYSARLLDRNFTPLRFSPSSFTYPPSSVRALQYCIRRTKMSVPCVMVSLVGTRKSGDMESGFGRDVADRI
jgi:hypothetical protein